MAEDEASQTAEAGRVNVKAMLKNFQVNEKASTLMLPQKHLQHVGVNQEVVKQPLKHKFGGTQWGTSTGPRWSSDNVGLHRRKSAGPTEMRSRFTGEMSFNARQLGLMFDSCLAGLRKLIDAWYTFVILGVGLGMKFSVT